MLYTTVMSSFNTPPTIDYWKYFHNTPLPQPIAYRVVVYIDGHLLVREQEGQEEARGGKRRSTPKK